MTDQTIATKGYTVTVEFPHPNGLQQITWAVTCDEPSRAEQAALRLAIDNARVTETRPLTEDELERLGMPPDSIRQVVPYPLTMMDALGPPLPGSGWEPVENSGGLWRWVGKGKGQDAS
jgi:hypothetical protein